MTIGRMAGMLMSRVIALSSSEVSLRGGCALGRADQMALYCGPASVNVIPTQSGLSLE